MIFNKNETDDGYVKARVVMERITDTIQDKLVFERDYDCGDWIGQDKAEELIMELHALVKRLG